MSTSTIDNEARRPWTAGALEPAPARRHAGPTAAAGLRSKPLLRGWVHAVATVVAAIATGVFLWQWQSESLGRIPIVVFGLSMVLLYSISAIYHIGEWDEPARDLLSSLDYANIFLFIAASYTPICCATLGGWQRFAMLTVIWLMSLTGVFLVLFTRRLSRQVRTGLYVGMGWVVALGFAVLSIELPGAAVAAMLLGGLGYTAGAIVYALQRPNPLPAIFGFHEVFHVLVIAANVAVAAAVWNVAA